MKNTLISAALLALLATTNFAQTGPPPVLRPASPSNSQSSPVAAPEDDPEIDEGDIVRVSTSLITLPAEVVDRNGRYAGNLKKEDFHIFDNGVEQELAYFASVEQLFTVALLLDVSGSTQTKMQAIRAAANIFIKRLRPNDRLSIISFDGRINVLSEPVTLGELRTKRLRLDALNDGTLLYDTVNYALHQSFAGISGRKAIVLLTDGVDFGSKRATLKQNLRDADEADVMIYTVQYNTLPQLPERLSRIIDGRARERMHAKLTKDYAVGSTYLRSLSEKTGGRLYAAESLSDLPNAFALITEELGRQYSLGYYPKGQIRDGETRNIKVRVSVPNLIVRARRTYVAKRPELSLKR